MMKVSRVLMAIATVALAMGLTGCGKDKYDGTYTGYQIRLPATSASPSPTTYTNYGMGTNTASPVTVTLANNGDSVTGTYQVTASNGIGTTGYYNPYNNGSNTGYNTGAYGAGESYQFTASSANAGSLSNVTLIATSSPYGSMYSNCGVMQGTLTSQNHGQTLSGTLSPLTNAASNCGSLQLQLTRGN